MCTWRLCSFPEIHGRAWWLLRLCKQIFKFEKIFHVLPAFRPFFFPKKNNRKHAFCPIWDVKLPLPLCLVSNKWRLLKMTVKKISKFIVFCKLLLGDVKVEISLISSHLLMVFRMRPQPAHSLPPSFVWKWNMLRWYISGISFIYMWHVILEFWYLKCSLSSKKYHFRLLLAGFLGVTPGNVKNLVWNFEQWCNAMWCIR